MCRPRLFYARPSYVVPWDWWSAEIFAPVAVGCTFVRTTDVVHCVGHRCGERSWTIRSLVRECDGERGFRWNRIWKLWLEYTPSEMSDDKHGAADVVQEGVVIFVACEL